MKTKNFISTVILIITAVLISSNSVAQTSNLDSINLEQIKRDSIIADSARSMDYILHIESQIDRQTPEENFLKYLHFHGRDSKLKGRFADVFKSEKNWKKFVMRNGKYLDIYALNIDWYDTKLGKKIDDNPRWHYNAVIIDSTVENYYNKNIRNFEYAYYKYKIIKTVGGMGEGYDFYDKYSRMIRSYSIFWLDFKVSLIRENTDLE